MIIQVKTIQSIDAHAWDEYVHAHPRATLYHLSGWRNVIQKTYGHKTYYLMALENGQQATTHYTQPSTNDKPRILGILPLIHLKHFLFGNSLISTPFFDLGGILADDDGIEKALLSEAIRVAQELKAKNIELRHTHPLSWINKSSKLKASRWNRNNGIPQGRQSSKCSPMGYQLSAISCFTRSHKVRMLLYLPASSEILMKSFKAKLRSQIKKPLKEGLGSKIGSVELLEDFYDVFSINMRDLGSPVHSKKLMRNVLEEFTDESKIVMVHKDDQPLACSLVIGFKDTLENPWASTLREYSRLSPNMLLYWTMLEYACENGYACFDFGRSSPDEGTYKFKEQWGAKPLPLHWHYISLDGQPVDEETPEKSKFEIAIQYWQKLPVPITKIIGPTIRKHISL
ncbi:MAG: GNAT family N-acetyltransferase [Desulfobacteraceae bacterium]|nr:MAG: GNAT family N-acetyltransferase [Desulfobacteraceae bacterium]